MADKPLALFLMGPTAAGKTDLAISLVEQGNCEIISVDSAQIYRGMDIGAAKPDAETLSRAPHHLIDICDPSESYSAVHFRKDALDLMSEISARGKVPLLTGGTMLYYKSLVEPMANMPAGDEQTRQQIAQKMQEEGLDSLVQELLEVDPVAHQKIDLQNPQRVQRALEVYRISGRPISSFWAEGVNDGKGKLSEVAIEQFPYRIAQYVVMPDDRAVLHRRIEKRFEMMIEQGFEYEVRTLYNRGDLHLDLPSIRCVGYRQMWQYFDGEFDFDTMIEKGVAATRQLAKRQLTWIRGWPQVTVLDTAEKNSTAYTQKVLDEVGF